MSFKKGDMVACLDARQCDNALTKGAIYTVESASTLYGVPAVMIRGEYFAPERFELLRPSARGNVAAPIASARGIGGAPTRPSTMPTDAAARKRAPVASGVLDYFPDALLAVAAVSFDGNDQHNPGAPLFWDRSKSADESDALMRHFMERGADDKDGHRHSAKVAWRALALLQKEIEAERVTLTDEHKASLPYPHGN
ncbi:MAG: hypothetical protein H0V63_13325 [Burkholderiaceae bacterium]|nr:hypothetical protein [Burkholderiaceae bacterium]